MQRKKKYLGIKQKAEATQAPVPKSKTITEPNHRSTPPTKKKPRMVAMQSQTGTRGKQYSIYAYRILWRG